MHSDYGRFFEGFSLEVQKLLRAVFDIANGLGSDVVSALNGAELVFHKVSPEKNPRGFLRILPAEFSVRLCFPAGQSIHDPRGRLKTSLSAQATCNLKSAHDFDLYYRRLLEEAYRNATS